MRDYLGVLAMLFVVTVVARDNQGQNDRDPSRIRYLVAARSMGTGSTHWTTTQILAPIVVGIGFILLGIAGFFWYRRHMHIRYTAVRAPELRHYTPANLQSPRKFGGLMRNVHAVRSRDRLSEWSIDVDAEDADERRISTTSLISSMPAQREATESIHLPAPLPPIRDAPTVGSLGRPTRGVARARIPIVHVVSVPPRGGFKIDDVDSRSPTVASLHGTLPGPGHELGLARRIWEREREVGGIGIRTERDALNERESWQIVDETDSMRGKDKGPGVLLISREPGEDFSLASVGSPTTEEASSPFTRDKHPSPPRARASSSRNPYPTSTPPAHVRRPSYNPFSPLRNPFASSARSPPPSAFPPALHTAANTSHLAAPTHFAPHKDAEHSAYAPGAPSSQGHSMDSSERQYTVPNPFTPARAPGQTQPQRHSLPSSFDLAG